MATSATLKSAQYTAIYNVQQHTASAEAFNNASKRKLRAMFSSWESATAYDDPSTISLMLLPKGARVLGFMVSWEAQGAAVTGDFEIGGVTASTAECVTDMTSAGAIGFIPAVAAFQESELAADSVLTLITAAQALGQDDAIFVTCVYTDED
jgi:hypothetical protein